MLRKPDKKKRDILSYRCRKYCSEYQGQQEEEGGGGITKIILSNFSLQLVEIGQTFCRYTDAPA
jgi:hypothetical protein